MLVVCCSFVVVGRGDTWGSLTQKSGFGICASKQRQGLEETSVSANVCRSGGAATRRLLVPQRIARLLLAVSLRSTVIAQSTECNNDRFAP